MKRTVFVFALALATLVLALPDASAGQFKKPVYYHVGPTSYGVIATELTKSGNVDLVASNYLSNQIRILLGNGDGSFKALPAFAVPAPIGVVAGDFDEDGNPDLAVLESGGTGNGAVAIFLGDGKGGFKLAKSYAVGVACIAVAAADFNGDGHLDVAVTNKGFNGPGSVMTFLGDGHGNLHKRATYKMNGGPFGIAAGDLNGDNHPDLAVTLDQAGSVAVLINDGTGHFKTPVTYNAGGGVGLADVKIADLRNNGKQDLVIANGSQGMVVLLNNSDGTFGKPTIYQPTFFNWQPPAACVVADFNLDGKLDVACAASGEDSYFFYGKGNGKFGPGIEIKDAINHNGGYSIAAGDFNNDKAPDLAIPIETNGKVAILLNIQ